MMKLAIGIPHNFVMIPSNFFDSMMMLKKPSGFIYIRDYSVNSIDIMRNTIVERALDESCTHLIMMDTDQLYHSDTLLQLLSHDLFVVGALVYRRYPPFDPLMFRGKINYYQSVNKWEENGLVEVDATGTGCLMFNTEVFKTIKKPWFKFKKNPNRVKGGVVGEDIGFCSELKKAGYKIYVDTSIPAGHLSTMVVDKNTYDWYKFTVEVNKQRSTIK